MKNRRSFVASLVAACVAPFALLWPKKASRTNADRASDAALIFALKMEGEIADRVVFRVKELHAEFDKQIEEVAREVAAKFFRERTQQGRRDEKAVRGMREGVAGAT